MASRVTIYGPTKDPNVKRLKRELNVMYVEHDEADLAKDAAAQRRLQEMIGSPPKLPLVEIHRQDGDGSVFLTNPDEPTLRHILLSENILSVTAYWV
ncbi:MAG: hypothetical protein M3Y28_09680 [Armatimonadota bacterium]|nr:hypothetical protein [Armatimonadota bacterium]